MILQERRVVHQVWCVRGLVSGPRCYWIELATSNQPQRVIPHPHDTDTLASSRREQSYKNCRNLHGYTDISVARHSA